MLLKAVTLRVVRPFYPVPLFAELKIITSGLSGFSCTLPGTVYHFFRSGTPRIL